MSVRMKKVEKEIQDIISTYMLNHFPYKNQIILTISNVAVGADLRSAKVYFSCYSPLDLEIDPKEVLQVLDEEKIDIQSFIHASLKMKFTPKLKFYFDSSMAENFALISKLRELGLARDYQI